ncbi:MAG: M50 family metallopeptidase [Gammaproteobacteria bacterium]|nr:M50 family metallopeptidase [Gammaproteobacteria bacterium]
MNQRLLFIIYCVIAVVITYIPVIGIGFKWIETIFHELSHAIMTVLTAGQVIEFKLELSGAGRVISRGGLDVAIAFSGYAGAAVWGFLLFQAGYRRRIIQTTLALLIVIFCVILILWVRDLLTGVILGAAIGLFSLMLRNERGRLLNWISQLIGVTVLFNAIKSPLYLLIPNMTGDEALLASITYIPEFVWIISWFSWGVYLLIKMWQLSEKNI